MSWPTSLAPGDSVSAVGFFVYRDDRTPAEPSGSAWTLNYLSVRVLYDGAKIGLYDGAKLGSIPNEIKELSLTGEPGLFDLVRP